MGEFQLLCGTSSVQEKEEWVTLECLMPNTVILNRYTRQGSSHGEKPLHTQ